MTLPRRLMLLLAMVLMALMLTAGPVFAAGLGGGNGSGNAVHLDNGNHTATGGGTLNNPHNQL